MQALLEKRKPGRPRPEAGRAPELAARLIIGDASRSVRLSVAGQPLHTRSLTLVLSQRPDGMLLAAGEVIDLRKVSMVPMIDATSRPSDAR